MALLPFDDRDGFIWFDGKLVAWREAKLHVLSHGLHYGSCVFEGERAYEGKSSNAASIRSASRPRPSFSTSKSPIPSTSSTRRSARWSRPMATPIAMSVPSLGAAAK